MKAERGQQVGLDIGSAYARAVWVSTGGAGLRVDRVETLALPSAGMSPDADVVRPWIEKIGLVGKPCMLGVPGPQCMFQPIRLAASDPRTPAQAAAMEVLKYNEMVSEPVLYGFALFEPSPGDRHLLLAMANPDVVQRRLDVARRIGVVAAELVPMPVAWYNGLRVLAAEQLSRSGEITLCLAVGASGTELAVGAGNDVLFARAFSTGGQLFTDRLARALGVPAGRAERVKRERGSLAEGAEDAEPLRGAADAWYAEVAACLSVYRSLYPEPGWRIKRILLSAGGACLQGLADLVRERAGLPVEIAAAPGAKGAGEAVPEAGAVGLAAAGLETWPAMRLSLLPESNRTEILFRRQKPYWVAAAAVGAVILAVSLLGGYRDYRRKARQLTTQEVSLRRRQQIAEQIEQIKERERVLREIAAPVQALLRSGPLIRDLIALVEAAKHEDDWITLVSDAATYFGDTGKPEEAAPPRLPGRRTPRPEAPRPEAAAPPTFRRLIVEGYTRNLSLATVRDLINRLAEAEWIRSADLLSDDILTGGDRGPVQAGGAPTRRFVIDVELAIP